MSQPILHSYQSDTADYINRLSVQYDVLAQRVRDHLGGMNNKVVLDLGVGFQLVHGGLWLALALQEGAKRCFGIDIAHPDLHSDDPAKVNFWLQASAALGIPVQGLERGRVVFASTDILHFDDFYSKITLLQMSASNMWFQDNMFDVVISNATFEHVRSPKLVLQELFRVLKPGGGAAIHWNPFSGFRMGGHDVGLPFTHPWAHLRLNKEAHIEALRQVFGDTTLYNMAFPAEHTPTDERAAVYHADPALFREQILYDLNKMRIPEFETYARDIGFEILSSVPMIDESERKYLTPQVRAELSDYSEEELLQHYHACVLRKPESKA